MKKLTALLLLIFFIYYAATAYFHFTQSPPKGDEVHYLLTTISIIKDKSLAIGERYDKKDYQLWYKSLDKHSVKGTDGKEYMYHGLGLYPVLLAPGYLLLGRWGSMLTMIMFAIGSLHFLFKIIEKVSSSKIVAILTTITVGLSLPFSEYAYLIFPEMVGVFIISVVIWSLINKKLNLSSAILIGLLPWIHIRFLAIAISLCGVYILQGKITKYKIRLVILSMSIAALYFIFLWKIFGSLDPRYPYILANVPVKPSNFLSNLVNALVDGQYGLLWYSPFVIFVIPGLLLWFKKTKVAVLFFIPAIFYLLVTLSYYDWNGGYSPPGRYILVIFPFIVPCVSYFYKKIKIKYVVLLSLLFSVWGTILYLINFFKTPDYGFIYFDGYVFFIHQISNYIRYDLVKYIPHFYPDSITTSEHYLYFAIFVLSGLILFKLKDK